MGDYCAGDVALGWDLRPCIQDTLGLMSITTKKLNICNISHVYKYVMYICACTYLQTLLYTYTQILLNEDRKIIAFQKSESITKFSRTKNYFLDEIAFCEGSFSANIFWQLILHEHRLWEQVFAVIWWSRKWKSIEHCQMRSVLMPLPFSPLLLFCSR